MLTADIQRFYGSVYTHSVPWVLHTKPWAKANLNAACLGNEIDRSLRNGQDGQTIGLPIGPDTSFVIAELLLSHVDLELGQTLGPVRGMRFMDEWEFAFDSVAEAERARAAIEERLAFLELELNPLKVTLSEGPVPLRPDWVTRLKTVALSEQNPTVAECMALFDTAFELSSQHRSKGVLNWAISRAMSCSLAWPTWRALEPMLLQAAAAEPGSLGRALRMICSARLQGHSPHPNRIADTLHAIIEQAAVRAHWSEVAWAIWGHILFSIPIAASEATHFAETDDPIVALTALDAHHRGLVSAQDIAPALHRWSTLMSPSSLDNRDWLLAYESSVKGWIPAAAPPTAGDPHFSLMAQSGVEFYRQAPPPEQLMMGHRGTAPDWMTQHLNYL